MPLHRFKEGKQTMPGRCQIAHLPCRLVPHRIRRHLAWALVSAGV